MALNRILFSALLVGLSGSFFSDFALAQCPKGQRQAGQITSPLEHILAVERAGRRISISSFDSLCTGDRIIAREKAVMVQLQWRNEPVQVARGSQYLVPSRNQVQMDLLSGLASFFFSQEERAGESAVTLAPQQVHFAVPGIDTGEARLASMPAQLQLPIVRSASETLTVRLTSPRGKTFVKSVDPGEPSPTFNNLPEIRGTWTVEAASANASVPGAFILDGLKPTVSAKNEDEILLWICENPQRNAMAGILELRASNGGTLSSRSRAILTRWFQPSSRSFCSQG